MRISSNKIVQVLDEMAIARGGRIGPRDIVEEASDPSHALHHKFEWRDDVAAAEHRLDQARQLLRIRIVHHIARQRLIIPAYTSLPENRGEEEGSYISTRKVLRDASLTSRAANEAIERLFSWWKNSRHLRRYLPRELVQVIEALEADGHEDVA